MKISRYWIIIPLISTCLLIIAIWLPYLTGGATLSIALLVLMAMVD